MGPKLLIVEDDSSLRGVLVRSLRAEGFGVLLAEQNAIFALAHADRVYILEKGAITHEGDADELRGSEELLAGLGVTRRMVSVAR